MPSRSLNKVTLIGNLTRDPELRYTPSGTAVCTLGLATNRYWTTDAGEKREDTEFHRLVAWNKLAELCSKLLFKGRKIYAEGRLQTRTWTGQDGNQRTTTEIVIDDMILLDSKRPEGMTAAGETSPVGTGAAPAAVAVTAITPADDSAKVKADTEEEKSKEEPKKEEPKKEESKKDEHGH